MKLGRPLNAEYRLALHLNAATTVGDFVKQYMKESEHTKAFQAEWGDRYLGEIQPQKLRGDFWNSPVYINDLPPQIQYSLQYALDDPDFQNVLKKAKDTNYLRTYQVSKKQYIKAGLVAQLVTIQHLGMANQLAHQKKENIGELIDILNDPEKYQTVRSEIARIFPQFLPHLPEKPYRFALMPYKNEIVKETESAYRKADEERYAPEKPIPGLKADPKNPRNDKPGSAGVFRIKDPLRITIYAQGSDNPTWEDWIGQNNQVFAYAITGMLGIELTETKNHISLAAKNIRNGTLPEDLKLHWPCSMFHGKKFSLTDDEEAYIGLSHEIQLACVNEKNGEYYKEETAKAREKARDDIKNNVDTGGQENHQNSIRNMWKKTISNLYKAVLEGKKDPSGKLVKEYLTDRSNKKKAIYDAFTGNKFDMSGANSLRNIAKTPHRQRILAKIIKPHKAKESTHQYV